MLSIFTALWRRWYGGWYPFGHPSDKYWYNKRWFQYTVLALATGVALFFTGIVWWKILVAIGILIGFYWGKGHGAFYDLGHHGYPDEEMLKRYEQAWGYKVACKIFPESAWYGYWFDTFLMFVRYTLPALALMPFLDWVTGFAGMGVTLSYMLGWYLQDKGFKFLGDKFNGLCGSATNFGELLGGFITGLLLVL